MKIAVAGGTGTVGRPIVEAARAAGHEVVLLTRSAGVDLTVPLLAADALRGVDTVIDVSNRPSMAASASVVFFERVTRTLLAGEKQAGVGHHVALSIVGAAEVDAGYLAGKAAQERLVMAEPGGWSLLRATQFHEFVPQLLKQGRMGPLQLVPRMRSRPVAAAEAAAALVRIAEAGPSGLVPDLGGPREERMADLGRRYLAAIGVRRRVLELSLPGRWGHSMRDGGMLPGPGATLGTQTFEEWLAER
ncbi:SDR family oxidoreductase [Xylanimonas sp. McL0601]|uniref:SDR family oxidoreductase n=1 Tax=Xylanimonas sp. McL0601 TaxID=3414739 RepID=UPI003CF0734E